MIKPIRNRSEYDTALEAIDALMAREPELGTADADELEVRALLVSEYEEAEFPGAAPTPLEAIQFRMEQQGLSPRDLVPYIGSRSKVSEVLAGKRRLSLRMIRALREGLDIPADVLLQDATSEIIEEQEIDCERFPLKEIVARGWLPQSAAATRETLCAALQRLIAPLDPSMQVATALYRRSNHVRSSRTMNWYALTAWTARVMQRAQHDRPESTYLPGTVTIDFMREVARLSWSETGPQLAREFLARNGIQLVVEAHLSRTHLDGAAILLRNVHPVIGMTLRFDRLDNFWFVLMHELAHIALHYDSGVLEFYDDLQSEGHDKLEREADELAGEALIPRDAWEKSPASKLRSQGAAEHLARTLRIHPAIVAGRVRKEFGSYRVLNQLVGQGQVRRQFAETTWSN